MNEPDFSPVYLQCGDPPLPDDTAGIEEARYEQVLAIETAALVLFPFFDRQLHQLFLELVDTSLYSVLFFHFRVLSAQPFDFEVNRVYLRHRFEKGSMGMADDGQDFFTAGKIIRELLRLKSLSAVVGYGAIFYTQGIGEIPQTELGQAVVILIPAGGLVAVKDEYFSISTLQAK